MGNINGFSQTEIVIVNETLKILRDHIERIEMHAGLCREIGFLYQNGTLSHSQHDLAYTMIQQNKPSGEFHSEFLKDESWTGNNYYWVVNEKGAKQRKLFVDKLILITN